MSAVARRERAETSGLHDRSRAAAHESHRAAARVSIGRRRANDDSSAQPLAFGASHCKLLPFASRPRTPRMNRLEPILADVRKRAAERRKKFSFERLEEHVKVDSWRRERFVTALAKPELTFVCEMKRRSPAAGVLFAEPDDPKRYVATRTPRVGPRWHALADAYRVGGAHAISVVTEEGHFGGNLDDLRAVEFTGITRMRRDFVLDESMVLESGLWGADAVLLLAEMHDDATLARLRAFAKEYGFAAVVEVHDERELERALAVEPEFVNVHADAATVARLVPRVPKGVQKIAESDFASADDVNRARAAGADSVLVTDALIRASDPEGTLRAWKESASGL